MCSRLERVAEPEMSLVAKPLQEEFNEKSDL
jgi:hypothetical protein